MKKITLVSLILFLLFSSSIEAKGGKVGVAKAITKSIPKIKRILNASKRNKFIAKKAIRKSVPKITGLYKFKASDGKPYVGKSTKTKNTNVQNRLIQHVRSGKLHPKDIKTISFSKVAKKDVSKIEKLKIMKADKITKGGLSNIHHAPRSNVKRASQEQKLILKKEVSKRKALLKTNF